MTKIEISNILVFLGLIVTKLNLIKQNEDFKLRNKIITSIFVRNIS